MVEAVVKELVKGEEDTRLKKIWSVLSDYFNASAVYHLHDRVNGGNNDKWQEVLALVKRREVLRDDLEKYLEEKV